MKLFGVSYVRLRCARQAAGSFTTLTTLQLVQQAPVWCQTHLYAFHAEVEVHTGHWLNSGRCSLQAEGRPKRQLARPPVVCQPSAAVVAGKTLAATIYAGSRGAAR